ncbi:MAG: DUF1153 domain-containing protein [Alphaproteobacteria bacterium]
MHEARHNSSGYDRDSVARTQAFSDLPPPDTKRWVIRRKAQVVAGVRNGVISLEDACARYTLSIEEFRTWQALIERHGVRGLRATRVQDYRAGTTDSGAGRHLR